MRGWGSRFRLPWRAERQIREEVEEEIAFHVEMRVEALVREGVDEATARARAEQEFGDRGAACEALRAADREIERGARRAEWWEALRHDVRLALRRSLGAPGFTAVAVLTLALGIGANTALFSVVHAALLRPLPYPAPDRLVVLWEDHQGRGGAADQSFNLPDFAALRERARSLDRVAAVYPDDAALVTDAGAERVVAPGVSHEYFELFGARPALGRFFRAEDGSPGGEAVVVLSHALWQRRFGADPDLVGRSVVLDGGPHTVVGIAGAGFRPPEGDSDLWMPLAAFSPSEAEARWRFYVLRVFGRLGRDVEPERVRGELDALSARLAADHPDRSEGVRLRAASLHERVVGSTGTALWILLGAAGLVLLLACVNLANLLLSRAAEREREFAVRAALGAGRGRIVRQLLTESLVLAGAGGLLGVGIAHAGVRLVVLLAPAGLPRVDEVAIDAVVLAFSVVLSLLTGIAFGLAPALRIARAELREGVRRTTAGDRSVTGRRRRSGSLVVAQVAIALVLLVGAGLLAGSWLRLHGVDPGFDPDGVLTAELRVTRSRYPEPAQVVAFYDELERRLAALPGVRAVGSTTVLPLDEESRQTALRVEGAGDLSGAEQPHAHYRFVSPGYFRAMGIALRAGRAFDGRDRSGARGVVIVNETLAARLWPGGDAIGRRVSPEWGADAWLTVVGVVEDVRHGGPGRSPLPELYLPAAQLSGGAGFRTLVVRTAGEPMQLAPQLRAAVADLDPALPVYDLATMADRLGDSVAMPRLYLSLFGLFAVLALGLAMLGIYGVLSAAVTRRTREIGIRMAVGGRSGDILRLVLGRGLALTGLGIGLGTASALVLTRLMEGMLFQVRPTDPIVLAGVALLLAAVGLIASYLPARRATRVDPRIALRAE